MTRNKKSGNRHIFNDLTPHPPSAPPLGISFSFLKNILSNGNFIKYNEISATE